MILTLDDTSLAAHIVQVLARRRGRPLTLASLTEHVGARRADVRRMVTRLHAEGFVDALRMRATLAGFAVASALAAERPRALRATRPLYAVA